MGQESRKYSKAETDGHLLIVTINRPEVYNALHPMANQELSDIFDDFERRPRAVGRDRHRRRRQGVLGRQRPQVPRRAAGQDGRWDTAQGLAASPTASTSTSRSSPPSTASRWAAASRSRWPATSSSPPSRPSSRCPSRASASPRGPAACSGCHAPSRSRRRWADADFRARARAGRL